MGGGGDGEPDAVVGAPYGGGVGKVAQVEVGVTAEQVHGASGQVGQRVRRVRRQRQQHGVPGAPTDGYDSGVGPARTVRPGLRVGPGPVGR
ncbi:hypothetical protein [Micromonospora echinospora]|uniref:hypothetical protein n=1 Tax=Micromonospora echinospora TaxID=1877 RepID=UPI003A879F4D